MASTVPQGKSPAVLLHSPPSPSNHHRPARHQAFNKYLLDEQRLCTCLCDSHHTLFSLGWFSFLSVPSVLRQVYPYFRAL